MNIFLELPNPTGPAHRARITYAFRLFCAIYGHQPLLSEQEAMGADISISYLPSSAPQRRPCLRLADLYRPRPLHERAAPPLRYHAYGETTIVHHEPSGGREPDWLGEIFEWVSCEDEYSVLEHDSVGRPLFEATYAGRHRLDVTVPYAAVAMRFLQRRICEVIPSAEEEPAGPDPSVSHLIVPTHDVDYFPVGRPHSIRRLTRNALVSWLLHDRPLLGAHQARLAVKTAFGARDPLDRISALAEEELSRGIDASYYFLVRHLHERDANYTLDQREVIRVIRWLQTMGMEIGIHNSYSCLDYAGGLNSECAMLRAQGISPQGGRQHWLRFTLGSLISSVEQAGLKYDASLGWSQRIGFRAGACFAFPPYNFEHERAASFLEIPLVVMDQALNPLQHGATIQEETDKVIATSRRMGWGGISLLWHPTSFGGGWLPREVGDVYWHLADNRMSWGDTWMQGSRFLRSVRDRYVDTGLLPEVVDQPETFGQGLVGSCVA